LIKAQSINRNSDFQNIQRLLLFLIQETPKLQTPTQNFIFLSSTYSTIEIPLFLLILAVLLGPRNLVTTTNTTRAAAPRPLLNIAVAKVWGIGARDIGFFGILGMWAFGSVFVSETAAHLFILTAGDGGPGSHF
jgi:hypothetical protein